MSKLSTTKLLKMARVAKLRAGNWDVVIDLPDFGTCLVSLCERADGWGGTIADAMRIDAIDKRVTKRSLNNKQLAKLEELTAEAERRAVGA